MTISVFRSQGHFWATFGQHLGNTIFDGMERNGTDFTEWILFSERNGTDFTERILFGNGTERILRNGFFLGTERNGTVHPCTKDTK